MKKYVNASENAGQRPDITIYNIIKAEVSPRGAAAGIFASQLNYEFDSFSELEYAFNAMAHKEFSVYWTSSNGYWKDTEDYLILPRGMSVESWWRQFENDVDYEVDLTDFVQVS